MTHFTEAIFTCAAILTFYAVWGFIKETQAAKQRLQAWADFMARDPYERKSMIENEELYHFHLVRSIVIPNTCVEIESTHTVAASTEDPFRTQHVILKAYPGWELIDIESRTDREFEQHFGSFEEPKRPNFDKSKNARNEGEDGFDMNDPRR